jgi:hypothetical protein
MLRHLTNAP